MSWHDNLIYGIGFDIGDSFAGGFRADLVFDIDHITQWICEDDGSVRFMVAPASLTFHNVTDLEMTVAFPASGHQTNINALSIADITREKIDDQKICLDRDYYRWHIALNLPQGGGISFGASGFTQVLRVDPIETDQPFLPGARRPGVGIQA